MSPFEYISVSGTQSAAYIHMEKELSLTIWRDKQTKTVMWLDARHMPVISATLEIEAGISQVEVNLVNLGNPASKYKGVGECDSVMEGS